MAVHIMKTAQSSAGQPLTFRNLFTCCYGAPKTTASYSSMTKLNNNEYESDSEGSSSSDEEIHENFSKVQRSTSSNFRSQYSLAAPNNVDLEAANLAEENPTTDNQAADSPTTKSSTAKSTTVKSHLSETTKKSKTSGNESQGRLSNKTQSGIVANGKVSLSHASSRVKTSLETHPEISVDEIELKKKGSHVTENAADDNSSESENDMVDLNDGEAYYSDDDKSSIISLKPISSCGFVNITFVYEHRKEKLNVMINSADKLPLKEEGGADCFQIRIVSLPQKKQRFATKMRGGSSPQFEETFTFTKMSQVIIRDLALRFRLYGCERKRRQNLIGEAVLALFNVNLTARQNFSLLLEPYINQTQTAKKSRDAADGMSSEVSSLADFKMNVQTNQSSELLVGISYNGITGRLACEIIKGSLLRCSGMLRAPDTFVKLMLLFANGQEHARSKTTIHRNDPNPLFRETFMFQIPMFQLPDVTLMVTIYAKRTMNRKQMIGWFSLGLNNTGDDELAHWNEMKEARGEQVCRWHSLLENAAK